ELLDACKRPEPVVANRGPGKSERLQLRAVGQLREALSRDGDLLPAEVPDGQRSKAGQLAEVFEAGVRQGRSVGGQFLERWQVRQRLRIRVGHLAVAVEGQLLEMR